MELKAMTRWRSAWRPGYNQRVGEELGRVLKPAVHQWIVDGANRNRSAEAIEIEIRRGLDPLSIAAIATNVTQALTVTYRRRLVLHQAALALITLICMFMTSDTSHRLMHTLLAGLPSHGVGPSVRTAYIEVAAGNGATWAFLAVMAILVVISFHIRHRTWLRRTGYAVQPSSATLKPDCG